MNLKIIRDIRLLDISSGRLYIAYEILEFLNGCILFDMGPINTKLENVANLNVFFLTMWDSCCLSHNKQTQAAPLDSKLGNAHNYYYLEA